MATSKGSRGMPTATKNKHNSQRLKESLNGIEDDSDSYEASLENVPNTCLPLNSFYMEILELLLLYTFHTDFF